MAENRVQVLWEAVVNERSYAIGGDSLAEHFTPKEKLSQALGSNTCGTCNTYNMLKLTRHLFFWEPRRLYADYYERALYNQILGSQNPETGIMCYFTPLSFDHKNRKQYCSPENSFWCCTGTGIENHAKYGDSDFISAKAERGLYVNLFIASELSWGAKGLTLRQETKYPEEGSTRLSFACAKPVGAETSCPATVLGGIGLQDPGQRHGPPIEDKPGSYATLAREWKNGNAVEVSMPFSLRTEGFRDNPRRVAFLHGPLVLCADAQTAGGSATCPCDRRRRMADRGQFEARARQTVNVHGAVASAASDAGAQRADVTLEPLYRMHGERSYTVYWDVAQPPDARWPAEKAWKWYAGVGPVSGCNYFPRTAVNATEIWEAATFDLKIMDQELGWAQQCGMNSVREFVQYVVYEDDPKGLVERMEQFLALAAEHKISVMFVLFDDCFLPEPKIGKQPDPIPGVHNSQWTSSPGERRKRKENWPALEKYVKDIVGHFADDKRVFVWDLYNEAKPESRPLVAATFASARSMPQSAVDELLAGGRPERHRDFSRLRRAGTSSRRPSGGGGGPPGPVYRERLPGPSARESSIRCPCLPNPGSAGTRAQLVRGRIQSYFPWGSPRGEPEPKLWFHDLLYPDGKPYRPEEIGPHPARFPRPVSPAGGSEAVIAEKPTPLFRPAPGSRVQSSFEKADRARPPGCRRV